MKKTVTILLYGLAVVLFLPAALFAITASAWGSWHTLITCAVLLLVAAATCFGLPMLVSKALRRPWVGGVTSLVLVTAAWGLIGGAQFGPLKIGHDTVQALSISQRTPEQNYKAAMTIMKTYPGSVGFPGDSEAFNRMKQAARQGYAPAQYELGMMYYNGFAMHYDQDASEKWLKRAVKAGSSKAKAELAFRQWWRGHRKPDEFAEELERFRQAGPDGVDIIPANIRLSLDVSGLPAWQQDERVALMKWSAAGGNRLAMTQLAEAYEKGQCNLKPDAKEAEKYKQMASGAVKLN